MRLLQSIDRTWRGYAIAVLSTGIAVIMILIYTPFRERGAFLLFLGAVSISTWYGGLRTGIIAMFLSGLASLYYVLPPLGSTNVTRFDDLVRLGLFFLISFLISSLHEARNRAVTQSTKNQQRLELAMESARIGVWDTNVKTGEFWRSESLADIFGTSGDFPDTFEDFFARMFPDDQDLFNRAITGTLEDGTSFLLEHRILYQGKETRWVQTRGRIIYDDKGKAERLVGAVSEITERQGEQTRHAVVTAT